MCGTLGELINAKIWFENLKGKVHSDDLVVDGSIDLRN